MKLIFPTILPTLRLQDILPSEEVDKIREIPIPLDEQGPDALYWPNSPGGAFSVREAYRYIAGGESTDEADWVWKLKISERCRTFLWLTAKDKLLTNEARTRRQLTDDSSCMACRNPCEDAGHIFKHCDIARVCWRISQTPNAFHHGASPTFSHWLHQNCSSVDIINGAKLYIHEAYMQYTTLLQLDGKQIRGTVAYVTDLEDNNNNDDTKFMAAAVVVAKDSWTTAAVAVDNSSCPRTPDSWTTMPDDTRFMDKELSSYAAADTRRAFLNPSLSSLTGEMERNFKFIVVDQE
nr:LINE-type retrotransposon LIb DNA [Ipomoea batatas]